MSDLQGIYRKATTCWVNVDIHLEPVSDWRENGRAYGEISSDVSHRRSPVSSWKAFIHPENVEAHV